MPWEYQAPARPRRGDGAVRRPRFRVVGGVVIGGLGLKLSGAGVHHLEGGHNALPLPQGLDLRPLLPRQGGDPGVGEAHLLGLPEGIRVQPAALQPVLHIHNILEPVQEP